MKSWTIGKRIGLGFALVVLLAVILGTVAFISLSRINSSSSELIEEGMPSALLLGRITTKVNESYALLAQHILASDPERMETIRLARANLNTELTDYYNQYQVYLRSEEDKQFYAKVLAIRKELLQRITECQRLSAEAEAGVAGDYLFNEVAPVFEEYTAMVQSHVDKEQQASVTLGHELEGIETVARNTLLYGGLGIIALALAGSLITIRQTNRALMSAVVSLDEGSLQLAATAEQVSAASSSLAEASSEQAATLEETSASLEEVASMTRNNADSARKATELANTTHVAAEDGAKEMEDMRRAMDAIKQSSSDISAIIKTIDEIAFQTNILALNAAVEAARAGEAGAGFAVVADEVRNLAQRSAQSAKETAAKIEVAIRNSDDGAVYCQKVAESLSDIVAKAREMDSLVAEIASASSEQSQGIAQVSTAVQQMDRVTQSNASNAEETASASEELHAHAESVRVIVKGLEALVVNPDKARNRKGRDTKSSGPGTNSTRVSTQDSRERTLSSLLN